MGTRDSSPGGKATGAGSDHSPHLVPRSKNKWSYTSTPPYSFMAWWSPKKHRDKFTFFLPFTSCYFSARQKLQTPY